MAAEDERVSYTGIGDKKVTLDVLKAYHEETASSGSSGSAEPEMVTGENFFGWKIGKLMILTLTGSFMNLGTGSFDQSTTFNLMRGGEIVNDYNPKDVVSTCVHAFDTMNQTMLHCKIDFMPTGTLTLYNTSGGTFPSGTSLSIVDPIIYPLA